MWRVLPALLLAFPASAGPMGPWPDEDLDTGIADEVPSTCPGTWLPDGVRLPPAPDLYRIWHPSRAWGTREMVELLQAAAAEVRWRVPDADPLVIGDISREGGGPLAGHRSHRGGLDADIGIYWGDARQSLQGFVPVPPRMVDAETNWILIRFLLESGRVERILLDRRIIAVIRRWTVESGELTPEEAERVFPTTGNPWTMTGVVHHVAGHHHHMHVRLRCPED